MDTMISLSKEMTRMTKDEVRKACPHAFATAPTNPAVSGKYVQANTETVIDDLARLGWYPVVAKQCRARKNSKGIRSFHMVGFQNDNVRILNPDGGTEAYVRIILQNSHDGFNSFKFMMGCYRLICSNGLVVCDNEFSSFSIRHINYSFEELRGIVAKVIDTVPEIIGKMNTMNRTVLTSGQKREMAVETYKIRKGIAEEDKVSVDDATIAGRRETSLNHLLLQDVEHAPQAVALVLVTGGFSAAGKNGKVRRQRPIISVKKDVDYNQRLWAFAERYMPATVTA